MTTRLTLIGAAAILSVALAAPALAQQAVQEPGNQAFYQSLGVGSHDRPASAMALAGSGVFAAVPTHRRVARHYAHARKM
ncbi:hypothetical protein [Bradyrhizobium sp. NP1]|jgi:hypothetical protein|uniref:hypothetical protein n=1 Tax=Bradyrhizobium sp. NP1 TaxID=3049772 RepID=UPI0025A688D6|nr:hypothetical protein [Bradyrhizobium sp. NP1]WJR77413.1 hypothetical protein QOU61_32580 [Bradyrhizobium sp. NP1]